MHSRLHSRERHGGLPGQPSNREIRLVTLREQSARRLASWCGLGYRVHRSRLFAAFRRGLPLLKSRATLCAPAHIGTVALATTLSFASDEGPLLPWIEVPIRSSGCPIASAPSPCEAALVREPAVR